MPYTYLLHHKPTNTFYYGVRWAKGCDPSELWVIYFSSSDRVALLRTLYGDESFEHEIRRIFKSGKVASRWECKILCRMKVLEKSDQWINRTTNRAISPEHINTESGKAKRQATLRANGKLAGDNNPSRRPEVKARISKSRMGQKPSQETKDLIARLATGRPHPHDKSYLTPDLLQRMWEGRICDWIVTHPNGRVEQVHNLAAFSKRQGLSESGVRSAYHNNRFYKGYSVEKLCVE